MADMSPHHFTVNFHPFTKVVYRDLYPAVDPTLPAMSQKGKVVMITGASKGIGKLGFAEAFAKSGAKAIIVTSRKVEDLKSTEEMLKQYNVEVLPLALEITNRASVEAAFEKVKARYGKIDTIVNNAGVFKSETQTIANGDPDKIWADIETNVKGQYLIARSFLQLVDGAKATYIGLSSLAAMLVAPGLGGYAIAKLGDLQLSAFIAAENPNVTAVSYHPGVVKTPMHDELVGFAHFAHDTAALAGAVGVWLATDSASFMSGRYMSMNWDINELLARKDEIVEKDLLKLQLSGEMAPATLGNEGVFD